MDELSHQETSHFARPWNQIFWMLLALALVTAGSVLILPSVQQVFLSNPALNGFIGLVFVIGVFSCFWQVVSLHFSVTWIEGFANDRPGHELVRAPRLLAPLAALLRSRGARMHINSSSARSILDSVATRIDEARDITRYLTNLLIFLGLLGTFYGLATTVPAVVETIRSLAPKEGDTSVVIFERLMSGLEKQLGGMGVAFGSSLMGLAGSLVVGLLELFASHGQNRFYRELEEWLSTITRIGFASGDGEGTGSGDLPTALLEHFSDQIDGLQVLLRQSDISRNTLDSRLEKLTEAIEAAAAGRDEPSTAADNNALNRVAEGQSDLIELLRKQAEAGAGPGHVDAESRMRLRSIDVQLLRILEEMSAGRQESIADLRADLSALTKAVRALAENARPGR